MIPIVQLQVHLPVRDRAAIEGAGMYSGAANVLLDGIYPTILP